MHGEHWHAMTKMKMRTNRRYAPHQLYSAPFEVIPYTEEPFSHHWLTPQPPRIQRSLFNCISIAHKNIFAQIPKKEANEKEQPSPPSSPAKGRRATEPF